MNHINLAYYRKRDWERFLASADDRDKLHETWKDWHRDYKKIKKKLISEGFTVKECVIDIDALTNYCRMKGIKNDGKARSGYVASFR